MQHHNKSLWQQHHERVYPHGDRSNTSQVLSGQRWKRRVKGHHTSGLWMMYKLLKVSRMGCFGRVRVLYTCNLVCVHRKTWLVWGKERVRRERLRERGEATLFKGPLRLYTLMRDLDCEALRPWQLHTGRRTSTQTDGHTQKNTYFLGLKWRGVR